MRGCVSRGVGSVWLLGSLVCKAAHDCLLACRARFKNCAQVRSA